MAKYIDASEAIKLSGLAESTFHRWVKQGKIKKYYPTKESKYGKYDLDEIIELRIIALRKNTSEEKQEDEWATDWLRVTDLGAFYDLEYGIYGEETGDPAVVRRWINRNPYVGRIIYNKSDRRELWGAINFLYVTEDLAQKLAAKQVKDIDIDPETQLLTLDEPGVYYLYAASVIVREDKRYLLTDLMQSYLDFWIEQAPQKRIGSIYGRAVSEEGELLAIRLQFSPLDWLSDKAYRLDLSRPSRVRIIKSFQKRIQEKDDG